MLSFTFVSRSQASSPSALISRFADLVANSAEPPALHVAARAFASPIAVSKFSLDHCAHALVPLASLSSRSAAVGGSRIHIEEFKRAVNVVLNRTQNLLEDKSSHAAANDAQGGGTRTLASLATSLAKLRVNNPGIIDALAAHAAKVKDPIPLVLLCRLCAETNYEPRNSLSLVAKAQPRLGRVKQKDTWTLHLALSALMLSQTPESLHRFASLLQSGLSSPRAADRQDVRTMRQVLAFEAPNLIPAGVIVSPPSNSIRTVTSQFQENVSSELEKMGLPFVVESEHGVDIVVTVNDKKIGLQCDGPTHLCWDGIHLEGRTLLRDRLLKPYYSQLERVSVSEWESMPCKQTLLRAKLNI